MLDPHPVRDESVQPVTGRLGPLDERDRVRPEVVVEQLRLFAVEARDPVEVDVRDRHVRPITLPDRERRAGHGHRDTKRAARAAHECRLARAELALHQDDVTRTKRSRQVGVGEDLMATIVRWTKSMVVVTGVVTVVSIALRHPIADLVGVKHFAWAAAFGLPAGCLYLELSLLRGALQGIGDYRSVGMSLVFEQGSRLVLGTVLAVAGLNLTGAYLGSLLSYVAMSVYCAFQLRNQTVGTSTMGVAKAALGLWSHVKRAWAPIVGLAVIAVLQNIDLIAAKHRLPGPHLQSAYAATAVAAKVLIWVAMGASFYLVPEVSRRRAAGEDTRGVLLRALGIVLVCAIPVLLIFAVAAHPLLAIAFSHKRASASSSLLPLGAAFTVLAATYLAVQYMLALKRTWFLIAIGAVAIAEPILLLQASRQPAGFATVVLAIQAVGALVAFVLALRRDKALPV